MAILFDGNEFAREREERLKAEIKKRKLKPKLVVVLIGDNPASRLFVKKKKEAAKRVGIGFELKEFKETVSESEIIGYIQKKNAEKRATGVMVQLPLPKKFDELKIRKAINPFKDVDCLHPKNLGLVMIGKPKFYPATVKAVLEILQGLVKNFQGREVVVVGGSNLVGKPLAMVLSNFGATVTLCRSTTINLTEHTRKADILISATGKKKLIKKEMVKKGAMVIDVGETKGDISSNVAQVASFFSPVPGGVGPVTVVSLLENCLKE